MPSGQAATAGGTRPGDQATPPAIALRDIHKSFGTVHANRGVSLEVERGSITGIVGENGAGKSTLMSILYGLYEADSGDILVDGRKVTIRTPRDAITAGIGMVHQHFMLIDTFTVLENAVLGAEQAGVLRKSFAAARAELASPRQRVRPEGRSRRPDRRSSRRRAAAGRNSQGAVSRRQDPDPRRADRRPDAAGDRPALPAFCGRCAIAASR